MMKGCRLLQDFLLPALRNGTFGEHLKWDPADSGVFMLKWTHKARSCWSANDATVFVAWDRIKGRPAAKTPLEFVNSKQRLRAALRNVKAVEEVDSDVSGYRKYRVLDMAALPLVQRSKGETRIVKKEIFTENKSNIKSEIEKKPSIKQEEKKLERGAKYTSRQTLSPGKTRLNKVKENYSGARIITRSLRAKKPVTYTEIDPDDDEDMNYFIQDENNAMNSKDGKLVMKVKKEPIRETRGKTQLNRSRNFKCKMINEENNSACKVKEDWHFTSTLFNCENGNVKKVKNENPMYYRGLFGGMKEKSHSEIIFNDDCIYRKLREKNAYQIGLIDIEKRMNGTEIHPKNEIVEQKVKDEKLPYYTYAVMDNEKEISKTGCRIATNANAAYEQDYIRNEVKESVKEQTRIDSGISVNAVYEQDYNQYLKEEPYDTYANLPWTYTKLEEKYAIPPITEQLPEKIFESDSEDEIVACSVSQQKNDDCIYLFSSEIPQSAEVSTTAKTIMQRELSKKHLLEETSDTLQQENTNAIKELDIIDEFIKEEIKRSKEKSISPIEPKLENGMSTIRNESSTYYQKTSLDIQNDVTFLEEIMSVDDMYYTELMSMDLERFYQCPPFNWKLEPFHFENLK